MIATDSIQVHSFASQPREGESVLRPEAIEAASARSFVVDVDGVPTVFDTAITANASGLLVPVRPGHFAALKD